MFSAAASRRIGVLISGRGSNLQSIIDAVADGELDAHIAVVISNRREAAGLTRAREAGLEAIHVDPREYSDRDSYEQAVVDGLQQHQTGLVCLAGYMKVAGPRLLAAFPDRMLNIHPSLLPAFPGLNAQRRALEYGVRVTGATVHMVTSELDGGPIILQAAVPVLADDTEERLSARILVEEHRIYPQAIQIVLQGEWFVDGRRFVRRAPTSPQRG